MFKTSDYIKWGVFGSVQVSQLILQLDPQRKTLKIPGLKFENKTPNLMAFIALA